MSDSQIPPALPRAENFHRAIQRQTKGLANQVDDETPIELPIDGVLDLHTFRPRDVKNVLLDFIDECRARGIFELRVIHGKGIGQLRQTVHAALAKHPRVRSFSLAGEAFGGSGATIVHLTSAEES